MKTTADLTRQSAAFFHLTGVCLFLIVLHLRALTTTAQTAPLYRLQTSLSSGLKAGAEIPFSERLIIVLRPSPGDNFWYRLPCIVQETGDLPPGIRLEPKDTVFHDLARFAGTPTQAGKFTAQLHATMVDGLTTTQETVTFSITDPRDGICTVSIDSLASGRGFVVGRPPQTVTFAATFRFTLPDWEGKLSFSASMIS